MNNTKIFQTKGYENLELSTQILIKEALNRNINVEIIDAKDNFILLSKNKKIEYVKQATRTSLDSYIAPLIMENKLVTKHILANTNINVPKGKSYTNIETALIDYKQFQNKNIVIKPKSTNFGIAVTIIKKNQPFPEYKQALTNAFEQDNTVLVEEFIAGKEYRFLVIENKVIAILLRVPANVIGNGINTIEELVKQKNKDPLRGKGYKTPLEKIMLGQFEQKFLAEQNKDFQTIPAKGETIYLRKNSNISTGGDSLDFTDEIVDSYKQIAIEATKAVGAIICGADIIINDYTIQPTKKNHSIIELNFNPAIHIHCFPFKGQNRHPEKKILDLLGFGD